MIFDLFELLMAKMLLPVIEEIVEPPKKKK
jgi:hypothetical protein